MINNDDIYELISKAQKGDIHAQDLIVENNMGLVGSVVKKFMGRGCEVEDLFQIGSIGLIKAVHKFDATFNVKFSTYAVPMIIGEIKRFLRDDGLIKVSRSLKEISGKVRTVKEDMIKELGREPTVSEISTRLAISPEELIAAMESSIAPESLHAPAVEDDSGSMSLMDKIDPASSETELQIIDKLALKQVLEALPPKERQIIILRYFKEKTQSQIASMLGISQVQVSRMEKKILNEMRQLMEIS